MAASDACVHASRAKALDAIEQALAPLITDYERQVDAVLTSQASFSLRLDLVLEELERVQKLAPPAGENVLAGYARKVVDLRQRMETVAYTMKRVHVRLDSLQTAVSRQEQLASQQRRAAEAARIAASSTQA